ncbi:hypothetical protein BDW02DRAFT_60840 [Decorospora gaudefroyi]|uniref:Uncharacterized protein n=1 Tax=Decorospora gaudefroyi TaxID=184978 RepID=A0A6A5K9A9_9PLEO|nr:hypothetical protein BDW02DRAFT_60840 [Decorospora gaudefroyi]
MVAHSTWDMNIICIVMRNFGGRTGGGKRWSIGMGQRRTRRVLQCQRSGVFTNHRTTTCYREVFMVFLATI